MGDLTIRERTALEKITGPISSVVDFLEKIHGAVKDTTPWNKATDFEWTELLEEGTPWGALAKGAAEAMGPVKFLLTVATDLTKVTDLDQLTWLACTLAYQRALEQALSDAGIPDPEAMKLSMEEDFDKLDATSTEGFRTFSYRYALLHPFTRTQDFAVDQYARLFGYSEKQRRIIRMSIHAEFVETLKDVLAESAIKGSDPFKPVREKLRDTSDDAVAHAWLAAHRAWLRTEFQHSPVLGREPFALSDVYIDTECGILAWEQIRGGPRGDRDKCDPFAENNGGRQDLVQAVIDQMKRPDFKDAIVVQGVAGSGKSAFTLKLANRLLDEGLHPVRVRVKDLRRFEDDVYQALSEAILVQDPGTVARFQRPGSALLDGRVFDTGIDFGQAHIASTVLILDGWDELTIAGSQSFRDRLKDLLPRLRDRLLRRPGQLPIRVILTGRPSPDLEGSSFLLDDTPIFTLRHIRPDQLEAYANKLGAGLSARRLQVDRWQAWNLDPATCDSAFDAYRDWFDIGADDRMDVLGLPLLALLAFRLMAEWTGDPAAIWREPTTLYRGLIDLTAEHAGKGVSADFDAETVHISGERLRQLLRDTAVAITAFGQDAIPYEELQLRLDLDDLDAEVSDATDGSVLHALVVAFFFKGGHRDLGCEFLHKSFREYLFAEAVVATLKQAAAAGLPTEAAKKEWWRDFDPDDHPEMHALTRNLSRLLAPHWLTADMREHMAALIEWEIARSSDVGWPSGTGSPTKPITLEQWATVRDALAGVWEWWMDGVHLRSQAARPRRGRPLAYPPPYLHQLLEEWVVPQADDNGGSVVPRMNSLDAHLGDGLFALTQHVHYALAVAQGWNRSWTGTSQSARYQTQRGDVVLFRPAGGAAGDFEKREGWWREITSRINAAGHRHVPFPVDADLRAIDLARAHCTFCDFSGADLRWCRLDQTALNHGRFSEAWLQGASMKFARMWGATFVGARMKGTQLAGAAIDEAWVETLIEAAQTGEPIRDVLNGGFITQEVERP